MMQDAIEAQSRTGSSRGTAAAVAVRLVALWVISVTLFKLFAGNPGDLPEVVRDLLPGIPAGLKFKLTIAIELGVSAVALLRPRLGWALQVPLLLVFVVILVPLVLSGAESCGCFGGAIKMTPVTMLAIDGAGLLAILATRPWSALPARPLQPGLLAIVLVVLAAAPFLLVRDTAPTTATRGADGAWQLPEALPRYAELDPAGQGWTGKALRDTELGIWMDVDQYPGDTTWILYRITCDHCARELERLANEWDQQTIYVLVRLPEKDEESFRQVSEEVVARLPHHEPEAILPTAIDWVCETPWTLTVQAGQVVAVRGRE
jgi:hypothetical protein